MLTEHIPNQNLDLVQPKSVDELAYRLRSRNWQHDRVTQNKLITDTLATLAACDTQTMGGNEFSQVNQLLKGLFAEYEESGDVQIYEVPYPNSTRTALIIAPKEDAK